MDVDAKAARDYARARSLARDSYARICKARHASAEEERVSSIGDKHASLEASVTGDDLECSTVLTPRTPLQSMAAGPKEVELADLPIKIAKRRNAPPSDFEMVPSVKAVIALEDSTDDDDWEHVERETTQFNKPTYAQILKNQTTSSHD